ncbi:hypothetical protein BU26DRAFT_606737 [Trematosphaeria pertusa]|uniref:Heterokaryon incompatibility domain-containing protein n=1 Tax=Trematosphaeria pertusa TaxID=390896 RepID=A0A6A6IAH5_9PLEO|nr:uncharacterized protein BU26DRAFT_606737 [Trematosphaeria pertusa]KAF2246493.1 hypothetical protein BU26DRAFT_606737 [Trematosphaeria pertusa]
METPQIFTTALFFEGQDEKLWPRRLLHVPSMTSVEREGEHTYLGVQKPDYNILSYTWGRYKISDGPTLQVKNIGWDIQPIDPLRFTVEDLETTLRVVSHGKPFIWIDIACIDQENYEVKMDEIGRQAGIFYNAKDAFIWLHGSSTQQLQRKFDHFFQLVARLDGEAVEEIAFDENTTITNNWEPDDAASEIFIGENTFLPHCIRDLDWINDMQRCLSGIIGDVWFSSLWTLQEASLRPDAWFISKEGSVIPRKGYAEVALMNLVHGMGEIERHLSKALYMNRPEEDHALDVVLPSLKVLESIVQRVGLGGWENPSTLYGSARFRECIDPLDRIYGIMQIFGFRLGAACDPSREYTLDNLEHQFATRINAGSPIMGQLFVHTEPVDLGKCWRISQNSHIRTALRLMSTMTLNLAQIRLDDSEQPVFAGPACDFRQIAQQWTMAEEKNEGWPFWGVDGAVHFIALDENEYWYSRIPEDLRHIETENFALNQSLSNLLLEISEDELQILLLGQLLDPEDEEEAFPPTMPGCVGILVRRVVFRERVAWQRLGLCVWAMDASREDTEGLWRTVEYALA